MSQKLSDDTLNQLFLDARSHNAWLEKIVSDGTLKQLYDVLRWGPTSANCSPLRIIFLRSAVAKQRLLPALGAGNQIKTLNAPVTAIIGYDPKFYDHLPVLFAHNTEMRKTFAQDPALAESTAQRNSSLQGGYLILAARALGLDCGPMSGFDQARVDDEFAECFPDSQFRSNFLCNLGYGDPDKLFPRSPRLDFNQACQLL